MIVLVLLIVAAALFGAAALYPLPTRTEPFRGILAAGLCAVAIALAIWHGSS